MAQILVVDDDFQILAMLKRTLEKTGYEVFTAINGKEAMKCIHQKPPDLVITDLIMPEKEGIETIIEIRQLFPDLKIIAMSGGGRIVPEHFLAIAKTIGADKIYAKPFDRKELLKGVRELLAA